MRGMARHTSIARRLTLIALLFGLLCAVPVAHAAPPKPDGGNRPPVTPGATIPPTVVPPQAERTACSIAAPPPGIAASTGALSLRDMRDDAQFPTQASFSVLAQNTSGQAITQATLYYQFEGAVAVQSLTLTFTPSPRVQLSATLPFSRTYLPPGARIMYWWAVEDATGAAVETPRRELFYVDERHPFAQTYRGAVCLRWDGGNSARSELATYADSQARQLAGLFGMSDGLKQPITITLYSEESDLFKGATVPISDLDFQGGASFPEYNVVLLALDPTATLTKTQKTLTRLLSNVVMYQATRNPYNRPPAWLSEGVAISLSDLVPNYFETALVQGVNARNLYSLSDLADHIPNIQDMDYGLAEAQCLSVVRYIIGHGGRNRLFAMVAAFKQGVTYDEAAQIGLGYDLATLEQRWQKWVAAQVRNGGSVFSNTTIPPASVTPQPTIATVTAAPTAPTAPVATATAVVGTAASRPANISLTQTNSGFPLWPFAGIAVLLVVVVFIFFGKERSIPSHPPRVVRADPHEQLPTRAWPVPPPGLPNDE